MQIAVQMAPGVTLITTPEGMRMRGVPVDKIQEAIERKRARLAQSDTVSVDRARFDRIAAVAGLAHEWVNAPEDSSIGRRAEDALTYAVDSLQPGDLDPLP